jgi:SAM-dependent methyltransferase
MSFENFYSEIYDSVHHDKRYDLEAEQIISFIQRRKLSGTRVLDFGCGTGKHAKLLYESGIDVYGYDPNANMIRVAQAKNSGVAFFDRITEIPGNFDFVYSLFDVFSYQTSESDVAQFLSSINSVVKPSGWVLLDGWHLPALAKDPPGSRTKFFSHNGMNYVREVEVLGMDLTGICTLNISIKEVEMDSIQHSEIHRIRAFDRSQIIKFVETAGGQNIHVHNGSNYEDPLKDLDWRFAVSYEL